MNSSLHGGKLDAETASIQDAPPVATLDHVVINVRDGMEAAARLYRRLGFTLTPLGRHTLGSINHLAMFGTDYLELIAVPPGGAARADVMDWPAGLNAVVFGTEDSDALHATLAASGAPVLPPLAFSRPVDVPGGARDAAFRTVRVAKEAVAAGRLYFCHHLTRDLVWRDEWRRHGNGVLGIAGIVVESEKPVTLGGLFRGLFGRGAVVPIASGLRLALALTSLDIVAPAEVSRRFGATAPAPDGRAERMVALVLRVSDLGMTRAALAAGGIAGVTRKADRLLVPASEAFGVTLEFRA